MNETGEAMILRFLRDDRRAVFASRVLLAKSNFRFFCLFENGIPQCLSGMHLSSYFGLEKTIKCQWETEVDKGRRDSYGRETLLVAAEGGPDGVVKLLLELGAQGNSKNNNGRTPLSSAAKKGFVEVVRLLLARATVACTR